MTCGGDKVAGQRVAQALLCKQGVGGSSPLVSTGNSLVDLPAPRAKNYDLGLLKPWCG